MGDLTLADAEVEVDENPCAVSVPKKREKRGRGRPAGTFGSKDWKEYCQEQDRERLAQLPKPGDIAYARACRAEKVQERHKQKEAFAVAADQMKLKIAVTPESTQALEEYFPPEVVSISSKKPLHLDLQTALLKSVQKGVEPDDQLTEKHLTGAMMTMSAKALESCTAENNVGRRILSISSAIFEWIALMWSCLLSFFVSSDSGMRPVLSMPRLRYDETPTKVKVLDHQDDVSALLDDSTLTIEQLCSLNVLQSEASTSAAKILQIELGIGSLLFDPKRDKYFWIYGQLPTCLYGLQSTTGSNTFLALKDCVDAVPSYRETSMKYAFNLRHTCSDRYLANNVAERHMNGYFPDATLIHLHCDVHRLYQCTRAAMDMAEKDISGCIAFALAFGDPGVVPRMRQVMSKILLRKLEVVFEPPPSDWIDDYKQYQAEVFDTFLPIYNVVPARAKLNRKRRFILGHFLNGAMWCPEVTHHCPYGCCSSELSTLKGVSIFVSWALIPTRCPMFPRSRWTNADIAIDFVGLLASVHSLLEPFALEMTGGPDKEHGEQQTKTKSDESSNLYDLLDSKAAIECEDEWNALLLEETGLAAEHQATQTTGVAAGDAKKVNTEPGSSEKFMAADTTTNDSGEAEAKADSESKLPFAFGEDAGSAPVMSGGERDWAAEKKQNKKKARAWAKSKPLARLVVLKETLALLMSLMYTFLSYTGQIFEERQRYREMQGKQRLYRVLQAYVGSDTQDTINKLSSQFFKPVAALVVDDYTPQILAMRFRMVARALCNLHCLIRLPRSGFPFKLFLAMKGRRMDIDAVLASKPCSHDALAHLFLQRYDPWMLIHGSVWQDVD